MGVGPGDEVLVSGYTCVVVPNAVLFLGAKPVYTDIDPRTFNQRPDAVERALTPYTRAIIIQHTYGIPADVDSLLAIAHARRLWTIEDCAHTIGSKWNGRAVGTFGDAAFYSSQWSKPLTTGIGGWVMTTNPEVFAKVRTVRESFRAGGGDFSLRSQYQVFRWLRHPQAMWPMQRIYRFLGSLGMGAGTGYQGDIEGRRPSDFEQKMSGWQERVLQRQWRERETINDHRREIGALYDELLTRCGLPSLGCPKGSECVLLRYPVRVKDKPRVLTEARWRGLEIGDWFNSPLHPKRDRWEECAYTPGSCPEAESAAKQVVTLPTHDRVSTRLARRMAEFVAPHWIG